ncbi:unnamed protein product [Rotaria sp. Silwood2]|nr:unnamed protein product [Rotaria sp. Silwood2]CAF4880495.1 unnamed protein product [Rotaria sp. Silwood2]
MLIIIHKPQATISSVSTQIIDEKSISHQIKKDTEENHDEALISFVKDNNPNLISTKSKSSTKGEINKEQLYYSTSLKQLLEQQNVVTETKDDNQQIQKSTLTVDEILAMYYSKVKQSTNIESNLLPSSSTYSNTHVTNFHILPSVPKWNSSENNQHIIPPPQLVLNKQNRNRPPPPSYSSSITNTHRTTSNSMQII